MKTKDINETKLLPLQNRYLIGYCPLHKNYQCLSLLNADKPWYSAKDLEVLLGKSHQYFSKIMKQGKLQARKTSAGYITGHEWVEHYIGEIL